MNNKINFCNTLYKFIKNSHILYQNIKKVSIGKFHIFHLKYHCLLYIRGCCKREKITYALYSIDNT